MKKLNKLNINPEKVMQNEELITLRGGYDGGAGTGYKCMVGETYIGCVNLVNCDREIGEFYCHSAFGGTYTVIYDCNVTLSDCYQW